MTTTVRDIARRASVSIATVSRVLNNNPGVNEATRYAVLKAVQELNYPIENVRTKAQVTQSVIVLTREDAQIDMREFERRVWGGAHSVLETHEIATRLQQSRFLPEDVLPLADDISVSGVLLLGGVINHTFVDGLVRREVPFVSVGSHLNFPNINAVVAEVAQGIRAGVEHLIAAGRTRIALVNGPLTTVTSTEKLDGYRLALAVNNIPFVSDMVANSDFSAQDGYAQTLALLAQQPDIDAIIFADDTIAVGGLRALREQGRRVPHDVAVIGFGDYEIGQYTDPPLTSIHFDMRQMGITAARRLMMLLSEPEQDGWLIRIPCSLVVRQSA
jgi:DNA-binding LacI/PurR family transcriptional regulator